MLSGLPLLLVILAAIVCIVLATSRLKMHPFLALVLVTMAVGFVVGMPGKQIVETMTGGFGALMSNIGLIIVLGTIIGVLLERSGAAMTIAALIIRLFGEKRLLAALSLIGGVVGVPVFCDSGFVILSNLNKTLAGRLNTTISGFSVSLATGLYATHVLVPPTPGPLAAAGNIGAGDDLGYIILCGVLVTIPAIGVGYLWARHAQKNIDAPVTEDIEPAVSGAKLPGVLASLTPILLPIVLIALQSICTIAGYTPSWIGVIGNPNIALLLGVLAAFLLLPGSRKQQMGQWTGEALVQAGPILLITAAGGAFGTLLKATPLTELFSSFVSEHHFSGAWFLVIVFLLSAGLKSSQGSSTAALVITSSLIAPLLASVGLVTPWHLAVVVLVIGGGAMTVSHANDSFFWVVSQFSGMTVTQTYRAFTIATFLQGITVLAASLVLYAFVG